MSFLTKIFGDVSSSFVKQNKAVLEKINGLEPSFEALTKEGLTAKTLEFKDRLSKGESLDALLPEAFAAVREASKRTSGQRHFDVQLLGGIALHQGNIAEMRTGEGKTLVATLPAYLNALTGKGVHIVTVNDYLSKRDAAWMGQIYNALGLSVAVIAHDSSFIYKEQSSSATAGISQDEQNKPLADKERDEKGSFHIVHEFLQPISRVEAYEADITYGTNSEFGFDYLRDNLEYDSQKVRQKRLGQNADSIQSGGHNFAIVDEIDSILIDEARTPLIISAPAQDSDSFYKKFADIANQLSVEEDYTVDEKMHATFITESGINKAEKLLGIDNIYAEGGVKLVHHLETAIKAKALYVKDKEYVVRDNEVVIVDPYTGRLQPGRRWSEGLHQAIEAKEGVSVQKESKTYASITYQNYFRMYQKLAGMTGTAATSAEEFYKVYGLTTIVIPTNKTPQRLDHNDLIFQTEKGKLKAIARKVKELQTKGQPVLIGTISIEKNELLAEYLKSEGVKFEMLNAKNHEREGEIISQAGRRSAVTVATNMAGRGVDIKLGGNPTTIEEANFVREVGGLFVLGTERHDARRIDNQLRGRSGRQGDPGETQFFVSMEDHIMRVFAADTVKNMMGRLGLAEDEAIENKLITRSLESAQSRIEGLNFDARKHVLEYDDVMNYQRKIFYERRRRILMGSEAEVLGYLEEILSTADPESKELISKKIASMQKSEFAMTLKNLSLQTFDMFWVEHLEQMDYLRGSVNLRAYGQRDPLVEYKKEGLMMFKNMEVSIVNTILESLKRLSDQKVTFSATGMDVQKQAERITTSSTSSNLPNPLYSKEGTGGEHKDIGRNDPCWCGAKKADGSPIKYKNCHGK